MSLLFGKKCVLNECEVHTYVLFFVFGGKSVLNECGEEKSPYKKSGDDNSPSPGSMESFYVYIHTYNIRMSIRYIPVRYRTHILKYIQYRLSHPNSLVRVGVAAPVRRHWAEARTTIKTTAQVTVGRIRHQNTLDRFSAVPALFFIEVVFAVLQ